MRVIPLVASVSAALLMVGCSSEDQLKRVESEVSDMRVEVFKLRQQMEETNRKLDGEKSANSEARSQDRRFQADLSETLRQLQDTTRIINNKMGNASRTTSSPSKLGLPSVPETSPTISDDEKAYGSAVLDYNRGSYALAAESLEIFLKSNKGSVRRPDAWFFLGLSQYNQKNFEKAQAAFDQIVREHSDSPQFLPAKLKRAQCMLKQGMKPAGVRALKELMEGFQGTPEARTAQQELSDLGL